MSGWEVRPSDPRRARRMRLALLVLLLAIPAAFYAGSWWQARSSQALTAQQQTLQARLSEQEQELDRLQQRLAVLSSGEKVAQQADEQNRLTIKLVNDQLAAYPDDTRALYLGAGALMALGQREKGLEWARRAVAVDPTDTGTSTTSPACTAWKDRKRKR